MSTKEITVEVGARTELGKNACRRLRKRGIIPGIVYGMGLDSFAVEVSPRRLGEILHLESGRNTIFNLVLQGSEGAQSRAAMIRDLVRDPITSDLVHVDFVRVDLDKTVHVSVPIRILGVAHGVKNEGGILEFIHREVNVECLPGKIPEHFDLDVTELGIGDHFSVKDVVAIKDVELLDDENTVLVSIAAPTVHEEETPAEGEEAAEVAEGEEAPAEATEDEKSDS